MAVTKNKLIFFAKIDSDSQRAHSNPSGLYIPDFVPFDYWIKLQNQRWNKFRGRLGGNG